MNDVAIRENDSPAIADDYLIQIADRAEQRIDAVVKIKKVALKVTNAQDWVDQQGKPYLMASGAEKIANLFNISWSFLTPEPMYEEEPDGHYTYIYKGRFTLGSRSIDADGSRSSKDGFFSQYDYTEEGGKKVRKEKSIHDRNNKRDVKMAALTNLLGNGISRILGIRNLTYNDLLEFAGIKKEELGKVEYKTDMKAPQSKSTTPSDAPGATEVIGLIEKVMKKEGGTKEKPWTKYSIFIGETAHNTFDKKIAEEAKVAEDMKVAVKIAYKEGKFGRDIESMTTADIEPTLPGVENA